MAGIRIASRYAKSLLDLAVETNSLEEVFGDINTIKGTLDGSPELTNMFKSPIISGAKKDSICKTIFDGKISALSSKFLSLLITKKREDNLSEITTSFIDQYNEMNRVVSAKIITATAANEEFLAKVKQQLTEATGVDKVSLETEVDPALLGGFVLKYEDKLIDNSVARKLSNLKKEFI